jgi:hypothetical protein
MYKFTTFLLQFHKLLLENLNARLCLLLFCRAIDQEVCFNLGNLSLQVSDHRPCLMILQS